MAEQVLVDTGPLVAIFSSRDTHHDVCVDKLRSSASAVQKLLESVSESSWLILADLGDDAPNWLSEFFSRFSDREPQLADAALIYLAEKLSIEVVFTLDQRDFSIYRTNDNRALRIVP